MREGGEGEVGEGGTSREYELKEKSAESYRDIENYNGRLVELPPSPPSPPPPPPPPPA